MGRGESGAGCCASEKTATTGRGFPFGVSTFHPDLPRPDKSGLVRTGLERLFHRHALGEVARFVHVLAADDGGVISQQLQRHHREHRLKRL